jgi:site-specific recombinase XerD
MQNVVKRTDLGSLIGSCLSERQYSKNWQKMMLGCIKKLEFFMNDKDIILYEDSVVNEFVVSMNSASPSMLRHIKRSITILNDFIQGKKYTRMSQRTNYLFPGQIGEHATRFIDDVAVCKRLSSSTLKLYTAALSRFSVEMNIRQVTCERMNKHDIIMFISSVQNLNAHIYVPLRIFLGYLHETGLTEDDFSLELKHLKSIRGSKLPSVYTPEEIGKLENGVQRGSVVGKRNYAILLLATRLGLRSSDIVNLEFSNIDWDNNIIRLVQVKTSRPIDLPLLCDVGEAIIDYVVNGRPKTELKKVFVTATNPVRLLKAADIWAIVSRLFKEAGIDTCGKHHGGHACRHSLATSILGNNIGLPVISGILGHASTQTTQVYLGVEIGTLLKVAHVVPPVDENFYCQKGGLFHE